MRIAPEAHLIGLKVIDAQGNGYMSNVIAAIEHAIAVKDVYNIRVMNLSVASGVFESYATDLLTLAARRAVDAGIVVVASAGNLGSSADGAVQYGGITSPENAPWVLTVGAASHGGTAHRSDDTLAPFSSRGPTWIDFSAKPDLVAPGVGTESLSERSSTLYSTQADYLLDGVRRARYKPYLSMSGTSMAAPVLTGTVALMLQAIPNLTLNAVKAILQYTAQDREGEALLAQGAGLLNSLGAVRMASFFGSPQDGPPLPVDLIEDEAVKWSRHVLWGNHRIHGGLPLPGSNAWRLDVTWGADTTPAGEALVWGVKVDDNIVWSTRDGGNIVWSTGGGDNIVWPFTTRAYAGGASAAAAATVVAAVLSVPPVWLALLAAAALYLAYRGVLRRIGDERQNSQQAAELHLATIEALVLAIEARDQTAPNHVQRVQAYATGLERAIGMSGIDVRAIRIAALLHDIGKLAIPEYILAKPGPVTPEEFQKIRIHPEVGAGIVHTVPFTSPIASFILSHHERWDGRGYPAGLQKEDIPLGARVIFVADYFDALTSSRPYHPAIGAEAAATVLTQDAGKALDPHLVETFVHALPKLTAMIEPITPAGPKLAPHVQAGEGLRTLGAPQANQPSTTAFDDIALAHRELYGLYQIAQSMGTRPGLSEMMPLITSRLSPVVPFSTCAVFL